MNNQTLLYRAFMGFLVVAAALSLSGCGQMQGEAVYPTTKGGHRYEAGEKPESVFGDGGIAGLFKGEEGKDGPTGDGIGVNSFLWRASLDTISFMPVTSADPFGGVILTDWYSAGQTPDERFKLNVYILDRALRADGLKVTVFRQTRSGPSGAWEDAPVSADTATKIENSILTRARELRVAQQAPSE